MPAPALTDLVARCRRSCSAARAEPDADLLRRFARGRDAAAFTELLDRYAPLVWGVCRGTLAGHADREDAFQAVFVALAARAGSIDPGRPLGAWLYVVTSRVARKARRRALARPVIETPADRPGPADVVREVTARELSRAVHEEVARLPDHLRAVVVLCGLEGRTRDEAADAIGCTVTAVKSRLERARRRLGDRLRRRGVELPLAFLVLGTGADRIEAALKDGAVAAALGSPPPSVAALAAATVPAGWRSALAGMVAVVTVGLAVVASGPAEPADPGRPPGKPTPAAGPDVAEGPRTDAIGDPLPAAALLRLGTTRFRHPGSAHALALSPDEKTVLTLGWEGLYAWDTATGQELWHAGGREVARDMNPAVGETRLVVLPDGRHAVTPGDGLTFKLWDVATGKAEIRKVATRGAPAGDNFRSVAVSPDGKTLALGGASGVYVCDLSGALVCRIPNDPGGPLGNPNRDRLLAWRPYSYARFAPDGKTLAVVGSDTPDVVRLCDPADGSETSRIRLSKRYLDSAYSPDGKLLAVAERDDTVRVYPADGGKPVWTWPVKITGANENYIFQVVFSPDGKTVAAASSDRLIRLWDAVTGQEVGRLTGHGWYPWGLAFTADGKTLYSTGWDGEVRRWDVATRKQLPLPVGVRGSSLVAYAPDGREVVYADGDNILRWVNVKTGQETRKVHAPDLSPSQMRFSPDGKALAVGGSNGDRVVACLLEAATGKVLKRWEWPKGKDPHADVEEFAFTADGRRLAAVVFRRSEVRIWDLTQDTPPLVLRHPQAYSASFAPDGQTLVTAGWDKKLRFWGPADGKLRKEHAVLPPKGVKPDPSGIATDTRLWAIAHTPDGRHLVGTDLGNRLWVWDADTLATRTVTGTGDIFRYNCLALSPCGSWAATGGASGRVKLWDVLTGELVWDRGAHRVNVFTVRFGRDGRTLLSGANDGLGYLWDLRPADVPAEKPDDLWDALVGPSGPQAYRAAWGMIDQPDAAVRVLSKQMGAVLASTDADELRGWVAALDAPGFADRDAAEKELARHPRAAAPVLRAALAKSQSAEQRQRIQRLLDRWDGMRARLRRAVAVLLAVGTPEAKELLGKWADADPDGDVGRVAGAALKTWR